MFLHIFLCDPQEIIPLTALNTQHIIGKKVNIIWLSYFHCNISYDDRVNDMKSFPLTYYCSEHLDNAEIQLNIDIFIKKFILTKKSISYLPWDLNFCWWEWCSYYILWITSGNSLSNIHCYGSWGRWFPLSIKRHHQNLICCIHLERYIRKKKNLEDKE